MTHTLEADSIQLEFDRKKILSSIYLKCETGKITGLLGRNGQGKSCLMNIIYGSLKCEKSIRFDSITQNEAFKHPDLVQYLPQFNFIPKFLSLKRIFKDFEIEYCAFEKRFPEFVSRYKSNIGSLSGGAYRLVETYIIIKSKAQFVMLDEPFTHLSPIHIEKIKELFVEEKKHKGILVTDHIYTHIVDISDQLYILTNGKSYLTKSIADIETLGYARMNG